MLARTRAVLAVLVAAAAVAIALPSTAQAASPQPKVGQCHQLTWRQAGADADSKRAVPCSARHDLQTVAVVTAPTSLSGLTEDELSDLAIRLCDKKWDTALSKSRTKRAQTAYSGFFFAPTGTQIAAGARWVRCDVGLLADSHLASLPKKRLSRPIIGKHIDDSERRCLTGKYWVTTCTSKHAYRSLTAFVLHTSAYPTADQQVAAANRHCPKTWDIVVPPSELGWTHGNRVAVCYDKTKK